MGEPISVRACVLLLFDFSEKGGGNSTERENDSGRT